MNLSDVNKKLKKYHARVKFLDEGYKFITRETQFSLPFYKGDPGVLDDKSLHKIAETIANETGKKSNEIYESLIKKEKKGDVIKLGLERKATTGVLILLSVGLVTLILSQTKYLTGFAISNISNTTSNIGILVCIVGIIGLLYYRLRCKP